LTPHGKRPLSQADKEEAFRIATRALPQWYANEIAVGMTDTALTSALEQVLGIFGGSCGPGRLDVAHQAAGLKIWGGWHFLNHRTEKPLFANAKTLAMARHIYGISDPDDEQMALFLVTSLSQLGQAFFARRLRDYRFDLALSSPRALAAYGRFRLSEPCTAWWLPRMQLKGCRTERDCKA
jgi:hypothetical protein